MEDMGVNWEQKTLISELIQGMELTKQLRVHLKLASPFETKDLLVQKILSSYEKALLILRWGGSMGKPQTLAATTSVPEFTLSINGSPRSEDFDKDNQDYGDVSKKRKTVPRWTSQVRVSAENALEGHDDGYNWRKYGQKDILGAKYPRSYYRCTYRNTQNCWATKQVQRSDDNPTMFEITYKVKHTCFQGSQSVPPPASPEKQEQKNPDHGKHISHQQQQRSQQLLNFHKELRVNTEEFDNTQMQSPFSFPSTFGGIRSISPALDNSNLIGSFSPSYISPATPEPDYFSLPACTMINFNGNHNAYRSEYDSTEIISSNSSSSNSPVLDSVFSLNPLEIDPNFPFDTSEFFS
ncbi:WRKY transcription factor 53 family protein [Tripterygium wilfordii]|uniref:WRKY transcription factor 53 family protein n=1 Tax=Tripterygium wilfordii TaxID=458696 RepID=A0A7J7C8A5_TRIWF|nr:probable WRKY transcription factor 53 [Tripterygium wilfordii]KAF5730067.1 WRKY transcription factor 53 family protein [Tripterygium wilfordii]